MTPALRLHGLGAVVEVRCAGASLVYVAPGGTGKTTLSRLLGRRFGDLTDETVGVDEAGMVVLVRDTVGGSADMEELSVMDAVFAVVEETSSLPRLEGPVHRLADLLDRGGPVLRVRYSEAPDFEDGLARLIGGGV
ncbi:hypothetical protein GCM10023153_33390 [Ornithinibacter aureus]|uniref:Uncharacterized protein n=1 Tax=Ornithinibacter aureus TaxID=622664 RepID=A0ABP8KAY2_9MICO|nr:hypothetical protein [Ornithinibacter aureus]KAF0832330.1 hypothetical protein C8E84_0067 [Ornithinibacter aureus]